MPQSNELQVSENKSSSEEIYKRSNELKDEGMP